MKNLLILLSIFICVNINAQSEVQTPWGYLWHHEINSTYLLIEEDCKIYPEDFIFDTLDYFGIFWPVYDTCNLNTFTLKLIGTRNYGLLSTTPMQHGICITAWGQTISIGNVLWHGPVSGDTLYFKIYDGSELLSHDIIDVEFALPIIAPLTDGYNFINNGMHVFADVTFNMSYATLLTWDNPIKYSVGYGNNSHYIFKSNISEIYNHYGNVFELDTLDYLGAFIIKNNIEICVGYMPYSTDGFLDTNTIGFNNLVYGSSHNINWQDTLLYTLWESTDIGDTLYWKLWDGSENVEHNIESIYFDTTITENGYLFKGNRSTHLITEINLEYIPLNEANQVQVPNNGGNVTSTELIENNINVIYPNPTNGILYLPTNGILYDLAGREILYLDKVNDISKLPNGIYIIKINNILNKIWKI